MEWDGDKRERESFIFLIFIFVFVFHFFLPSALLIILEKFFGLFFPGRRFAGLRFLFVFKLLL